MHRTLIASSFFCASIASFSQSTAVGWGDVIDVGQQGQSYLRPRLALNASNDPVVLWGRSSPAANFVSVGNGATFSSPVEVNPLGVQPSVADWAGSSIAAYGNSLWTVFKALPEDAAPCYVVRSDDGGFTWGDTLRVDPNDSLVSRFPSIAVNANGPVVQYMQFTTGYLEPRQVVTSMMGGEFMAPAQVSSPFATGEVCDCCPGQVAVDGDGVIAMYRNAGTNTRVMWGAVSANGGMDFPTGAQLDATDWQLDVCPSSGPAGFIDGDSLRYVWMSGATNGTKVYFGSALATDLTVGAWGLVHPGQVAGVQQNFPRIAGSGDTLGVVWQQNFGSQAEVLFSWSTTGFAGLSIPDTVNATLTGAQKTPDIAFANGAFHLVWSDVSAGTVRYRKATLMDVTGIEEATARRGVELWPVPTNDRISMNWGTLSPRTISLVDATGRTVTELPANTTSLDVSRLDPGLYRLMAFGKGPYMIASVPLLIVR
jgi:hypothetical protein